MSFLKQELPGLDRVVGADVETEEAIIEARAERMMNSQEIRSYERLLTEEEQEISRFIVGKLTEFIEGYGADRVKLAHPSQVHLVDLAKKVEAKFIEGVKAHYSSYDGRIEVLDDYMSKLGFAKTVVHEFMHHQSFESRILVSKDEPVKHRRSGLLVETKTDDDYFGLMNEAVIEELAKRFVERYFTDIEVLRPEAEEYQARSGAASVSVFSDLIFEQFDDQCIYSYQNTRMVFAGILESIYDKHQAVFNDREAVFKVFSKAVFTGDLMEIARLIEKTFGNGTFRRIGGIFSRAAEVDKAANIYTDAVNKSRLE